MPDSPAPAVVTPDGWSVIRTTSPRSLSGSNGLRLGPDGALYIASAFGSEIARLDVDTAELSILSPRGSAIVSPDDLVFDSHGRLYVAECMDARVTELADGHYRVIDDDVSGANGIALHEDRIFVGQFIPDGTIYEVFRDDRPKVAIASGLDGPNGMTVGPDRCLYAVLVFPGQLVRVPIDGGEVEVVAEGLAAPCSARTGPDGLIYVGLGGSGEVITLDPTTLETRVVHRGPDGMDNLDISAEGRLFTSYYIDGSIYEVLGQDRSRQLLPSGLMAPYGLAATSAGLCIADGLGAAVLTNDGELVRTEKITDSGFPSYVRGLGATVDREHMFVTNNLGSVSRHAAGSWTTSDTWAEGLGELAGVAATEAGGAVVAVPADGRVLHLPAPGRVEVLTTAMARPVGVAVLADGSVLVTDEDAGTVERIADGSRTVLLTGLDHPQDLAVRGDQVLVAEVGRERLVTVPSTGGTPTVVASGLPIGGGDGSMRPTLNGLPDMIPGPIAPFVGVEVDDQGRVYVSGDSLGVVIVLDTTA